MTGRADVLAATILAALAAAIGRLLISGEYLAYVRAEMAPALALSAAFLAGLAAWTVRSANHPPPAHLPAVSWLLLWPVLVVLVVAPGSLGAVTAARSVAGPPPDPASSAGFGPLPPGDPVGLTVAEYVDRALLGGEATLVGRRVTVLGFVTPDPAAGGWSLTRLQIRCCAADALPIRVRAVGAADQPADRWVRVTGSYLPPTPAGEPRLGVETVVLADEPEQPYLYG